MKRKYLLYLIGLVALILVLGSSVKFRRLDEKRAEERASRFSPAEYARDFWDNQLPTTLGDARAAVAQGRTLGQSRVHAYLLQGAGRIVAIEKDGLFVRVLPEDPGPEVMVCIGNYISGNAVRDASGLVDVSAFSDTMKFNRISGEINRIVVQEVITPFLARTPKVGMSVYFIGAAEVAEDATEKTPFGGRERPEESNGPWHLLKVVPIRLEVE